MTTPVLSYLSPNFPCSTKITRTLSSNPSRFPWLAVTELQTSNFSSLGVFTYKKLSTDALGTEIALTFVDSASAAEFPQLGSSLLLSEPSNALSLPTWAIHVSSVMEWVTAMILVWQYGNISGYEAWKGLSWGMVPALGGALCACTWHFFYNSESLEILVSLQAALTVIGNTALCVAAFRIYKSSQRQSETR